MHQALYRKWRPKSFDDVYGQEHITSILKYEAEKNNFSHAYLFCGSRGTGKTTCAKILAKVVNCENPKDGNPCGECDSCRAIDSGAATDVLEMDAASNNSVENIRDIRDEVVYPPSMLKYRVYIVDEVHMLSDSAFNALLKTLEEPPSYVIFILATTELHELPATIISRCQRFEFRRIGIDVLTARLSQIAEAEGIRIDRGGLQVIAKLAQGGMRDAISLLELCAGGRRDVLIDEARVNEIVGVSSRETLCRVARAIYDRDLSLIFEVIDDIVRSSKDIGVFWQDLMSFYRDMLVMKTAENAAKYLDLTDSETVQLSEVAALFTKETILAHCRQLENALFAIQKSNAVKRTVAEMTLVKMCDERLDSSPDSLLSRISKLEDAMVLGMSARKSEPRMPSKIELDSSELKSENGKPKTEATDSPKTARALSCYAEVIDRIAESGSHAAPYLRQTKGYAAPDGRIIIRASDPFTMLMVNTPEARESLRAALSVCLGREVGEDQLLIEEKAKNIDDENDILIDEILKNAEN